MEEVDKKSHNSEENNEEEDFDPLGEDFSVQFVKSLLRMQSHQVELPNSKEHYDIYLGKVLYPVLVPALEELSREILRMTDNPEMIDPSIRNRFNPCIFLGEFLMRNNPKYGAKLEYADLFVQYARVEKIRRFFVIKRQKIFKHFTLQPYHANFCRKDISQYVSTLDNFLQMEKKLVDNFKPEEHWPESEPNEQIGFDGFYEELAKWGVSQELLEYNDFARSDQEQHMDVEKFKKMTDRIV